jgi:gluconokinase
MSKKQPCVLTIDIGTSATKVIAFDFSGNELVNRTGSYPTFYPNPGWSEQDPEQVFITILFLLKGILNDTHFAARYDVECIVFSSSMHSVVPLGKNNVPVGNAIIWSDNRAGELAMELKMSELGKTIYSNSGTPIHAMSPLSKISWFYKYDPAKFQQTARYVSIKEYVIYQLTGEFFVDYSLASATGLFNLRNKEWDETAMQYAHVDSSYFSEPVPIYFDQLRIKEPLLKSLKLGKNIKLIIGSTDGCLASLSCGSMSPNNAVVSITSSGAVRMVGKEFLKDEKGTFFNYILKDDIFISGGPTNNGGVAFEWAVRTIINSSFSKSFEEELAYLQDEAIKVSPGARGLVFLPYIQGERAPLWSSNARGTLFGLNITHDPKDLARAVIEGIVFEIYSIATFIKKYRDIKQLHLTGYYATHPLWSSIICDVFGLPASVSSYKYSPNLGAAMVGLRAIGVFENLEKALSIAPQGIELNPSTRKNKAYARVFSIFDRLTQKLESEFEEISRLQSESVGM